MRSRDSTAVRANVATAITIAAIALAAWVYVRASITPAYSAQVEAFCGGSERPSAQIAEPSAAQIQQMERLWQEYDDAKKRNQRVRAITSATLAMEIVEQSCGINHPKTAGIYYVQGYRLLSRGDYDEAEAFLRWSITINEKMFGLAHTDTAHSVLLLGQVMLRQRRNVGAELLFRKALQSFERIGSDPGVAMSLHFLGRSLTAQSKLGAAQTELSRAIALRERLYGFASEPVKATLLDAGINLRLSKQLVDAERILRRAREMDSRDSGVNLRVLIALGWTLLDLGKALEAKSTLSEAVAIGRSKEVGLGKLDAREALFALATAKQLLGEHPEAVSLYREACPTHESIDLQSEVSAEFRSCTGEQAAALFALAKIGTQSAVTPALREEAFQAAQVATPSPAGRALARYGARIQAESRGVGDAADRYEAAYRRRAHRSNDYVETFSRSDTSAIREREVLLKTLGELDLEVAEFEDRLRLQSPVYWDLKAPSPIPAPSLQARSGPNSVLLTEDEAIVQFLITERSQRGLVFAASKDRFGWAEIAMSGSDVSRAVGTLRAQIDPLAYGLDARLNSGSTFDRSLAHRLYVALLGAREIADVIRDKSTLLFVPSGPLWTLPPGVLVTSPPNGGVQGDSDPASLRETDWLIRHKAIAILPDITSLVVLRQLMPRRDAMIADFHPLIGFADPDFAGEQYGHERPIRSKSVTRDVPDLAQAYYRDGRPIQERLRALGRLEGTRKEVESLRATLGAPASSLYLWQNASETTVRSLAQRGDLRRARVLEFATHGLIAGRFLGLEEPGLALASPPPGTSPDFDDGLLVASEVAELSVNADWVILSACNTAAPDQPAANGLSGLSRAFFLAGARSLLVSHWRVRDDVAPIQVPDAIKRLQVNAAIGKAEAVRQATIAILDSRDHPDYSHPAAWAPFVLIGEPSR